MRKLHANFLGAALLMLLPTGSAHAIGVPSAGNTTLPSFICLVGSDGTSSARAFGEFEVIHRDLANNPVPNALVVVDISNIPELVLAADPMDPDAIVDCLGKTVSKRTDANGRVVFCVVGAGTDAVPSVTLLNGGRVYASGVLVGSPTVSAFDLDGKVGLGAVDLVEFIDDFASGLPYGRCDFDGSGIIGAGDFSIWLRAFSSGTQIVSAFPNCP